MLTVFNTMSNNIHSEAGADTRLRHRTNKSLSDMPLACLDNTDFLDSTIINTRVESEISFNLQELGRNNSGTRAQP